MSKKYKNKNPSNQKINEVINYFHKKKFKEAQFLAEKITKEFPKHPISWKILGLLYLMSGKLNDALIANQKAIKLVPNSTEILNNLSITFYKLGKFTDAIKSAKKALVIDPNFHPAYAILSDVLKEKKKFNDASFYLEKAISINPNNISYYSSFAEVLHKLGKTSEAISMYNKVVNLNSNHYQSFLNIANLLVETKKFKEAEDTYNKVIKIKPDLDLGFLNLANLQKNLNRYEDAIENYLKAIKNNPNQAEVHYNLANTYLEIGEINEAKLSYEKAIEINPNNPKFQSNKLLILNYNPDFDQNYIYEEHLLFDKYFNKNKVKFISKTKNQNLNKRLRIGYVSPDFRKHSVAYFFDSLIKNHNKKIVEIFCYYNNDIIDDTTKRIKSYCKNWRSIVYKSNEKVIQMIKDDKIDILVDLCGHSAGNSLVVFAAKPAPLQITYLGYPNTTGLSTIDYRITDKIADPERNSDLFYSEKLVRVSKCFLCYSGNDDIKVNNLPPFHNNNFITFGSFNNFKKINKKVIEVWSSILKTIPKSRLILKNSGTDHSSTIMLKKFYDQGVNRDNIIIYNKMPNMLDHMNLYNSIDIALDTFPYNGATTTFEALWMGVPVITFSGTTHASRVSSSILYNLNLEILIGKDVTDYKKIAMKISNCKKFLLEMRQGLRNQMKNSHLCDGKSFASEIEAKYYDIWNKNH